MSDIFRFIGQPKHGKLTAPQLYGLELWMTDQDTSFPMVEMNL